MLYIRIYLTVRRHKNQMQSIQIRGEAQSDGMKNFAARIKSAVGIFYVYPAHIICYLPFQICWACIKFYGSSISLKMLFLFPLTLIFLDSSSNPVIYCWKLIDIRQAIIDVLRNMSRTEIHFAKFEIAPQVFSLLATKPVFVTCKSRM